jgi:hypothetical protein
VIIYQELENEEGFIGIKKAGPQRPCLKNYSSDLTGLTAAGSTSDAGPPDPPTRNPGAFRGIKTAGCGLPLPSFLTLLFGYGILALGNLLPPP